MRCRFFRSIKGKIRRYRVTYNEIITDVRYNYVTDVIITDGMYKKEGEENGNKIWLFEIMMDGKDEGDGQEQGKRWELRG